MTHCVLHESPDATVHATTTAEAAEVRIERSLKWLAKQSADVQRLFCQHGQYRGANLVLDSCCMCREIEEG